MVASTTKLKSKLVVIYKKLYRSSKKTAAV